jgi:molybdopterin synthase catalytic subunit
MIDVRIQAGEFDPGRQLRRFEMLSRAAIASFTAIAQAGEGVTEILVEHHAVLAKSELGRIAAEADGRWPLAGIILIHRHGRLAPGSRIALAAVAASDQGAALEACAFLAEALRIRAPFWRKELKADGTGYWVEPR